MCHFGLLAVLIPVALMCAPLAAVAQSPHEKSPGVTVERIRAAWRERQAAVESLSVSWKRTMIVLPGGKEQRAGKRAVATPLPQKAGEKTQSDERHQLALRGERISWSTTGGRPAGHGSPELRPVTERKIFDGTRFISFGLTEDFEGSQFPQAVLQSGRRSLLADEMLLPILLNLRPLDADLKQVFDLKTFELEEGLTRIGDRECLRMTSRNRVIWVAPDADFAVVRYAFLTQDLRTVVLETTIDVQRSPAGRYVPKAWSTRKPDVWQSEIVVDKLEINPDLNDAEFQVVFPPRTLVIDHLQPDSKSSIVVPDGSLFDVTGARTYKTALKLANAGND